MKILTILLINRLTKLARSSSIFVHFLKRQSNFRPLPNPSFDASTSNFYVSILSSSSICSDFSLYKEIFNLELSDIQYVIESIVRKGFFLLFLRLDEFQPQRNSRLSCCTLIDAMLIHLDSINRRLYNLENIGKIEFSVSTTNYKEGLEKAQNIVDFILDRYPIEVNTSDKNLQTKLFLFKHISLLVSFKN